MGLFMHDFWHPLCLENFPRKMKLWEVTEGGEGGAKLARQDPHTHTPSQAACKGGLLPASHLSMQAQNRIVMAVWGCHLSPHSGVYSTSIAPL